MWIQTLCVLPGCFHHPKLFSATDSKSVWSHTTNTHPNPSRPTGGTTGRLWAVCVWLAGGCRQAKGSTFHFNTIWKAAHQVAQLDLTHGWGPPAWSDKGSPTLPWPGAPQEPTGLTRHNDNIMCPHETWTLVSPPVSSSAAYVESPTLVKTALLSGSFICSSFDFEFHYRSDVTFYIYVYFSKWRKLYMDAE